MPMDSALESILTGELAAGARADAKLSGVVDRNLTQGLGVVNTTLIQQHGSTADDAATMAALRTSIYVPEKQGA